MTSFRTPDVASSPTEGVADGTDADGSAARPARDDRYGGPERRRTPVRGGGPPPTAHLDSGR
ncbi:hypothetical protein ACFQL0_00815 [Haloplanus litoreus]|uniref:hypothetical protein n=1 Tax=Haloplanus litoreus TaxID=767515 RepID=UPI0036137257